ncbi:MAG TPA: hypothetical protein VL633_09160 [Bacteroidota bacterium]|jgi:hypothetical protein|nr:hypothetical protein [Bacteroidota bacterium]
MVQAGRIITKYVSIADYSQSYYFVDTVYRKYWEPLHASTNPIITSEMMENEIWQLDVWLRVPTSIITDRSLVRGSAYANLPSHPPGEFYPVGFESSLITSPGFYSSGYFKKLEPFTDYTFLHSGAQLYGGYVVLNRPLSANEALAVTYSAGTPERVYGSTVYGDTANNGDIILKLIKPDQELSPLIKPAWDLQIRSVYSTDIKYPRPDNFDFHIYKEAGGRRDEDVLGVPLLRVVGLDRFDQALNPIPDGRFDFLPNLTIDLERGDIIFPTLRPFDSTIVQYFREASTVVPDSLLFHELYDATRSVVTSHPPMYGLRIRQAVLE